MVKDEQDSSPGLDEVAAALYRERLGDFTEARNRFAREARSAGDKDLAGAIAKLRKPTLSAWLANLLAFEQSDEIAELLSVGEELRAAQQSLSGEDLRRLSARRNEVVGALTASARALADEQGVSTSAAALEELRGTLEAALVDPEAGDDLRRGRLAEPLRYSGLGLESLAAVPVRSKKSATPAASLARRGGKDDTAAPSDTQADTNRVRHRAAADRLAQAARELEERRRQRKEVAGELHDLRTELARLDTRRARLVARETELTGRLQQAVADLKSAERAHDAAQSAVDR